jgi:hypothetical protein
MTALNVLRDRLASTEPKLLDIPLESIVDNR